jgi:hypothetical protein
MLNFTFTGICDLQNNQNRCELLQLLPGLHGDGDLGEERDATYGVRRKPCVTKFGSP